MTFWCVEMCMDYEGAIKQKFFKELKNASAQLEQWKDEITASSYYNEFYVTLEEVEFEDS